MSRPPAPSDRREFLSSVAAAAVVLAGSACAAPASAQGVRVVSAPAGATPSFDDAWTKRVAAAGHKAVFDSAFVADGIVLDQADTYLAGYREMFGAAGATVVPVIVMRAMGTPLAMNDVLWERYALGEMLKVNDPVTGAFAKRNPFIVVKEGERHPVVSVTSSLESLRARGAVLLACNRALMHFATVSAKKTNRDVDEVKAEFRANLVPGVQLQPSGIYASTRAQEVGCSFMKSS